MYVCPTNYATHATLQALPECWRGLDLRPASGKMLKVWGMREVVYNAMNLHGKVFTVKIPSLSLHGHISHKTCLCTYRLSAQISHTCIHTSREHAWLKHNKVSKNSSSSTCRVSSFAALDTDFQHKPTLTCLTYLPIILSLTIRSTESRSFLSTAMIHGGVAELRNLHLPQVMSPRRSSSTGPCSTFQIRRSMIDVLKLNIKIY